jgi:hypothetical protein
LQQCLGGRLIASFLHHDIQDHTICTYCPPEIKGLTVHLDIHFVEMPRIRGLRTATADLGRNGWAELVAPTADALVRNDDTPLEHQLLNAAMAEWEAKVQADALDDDFIATVAERGGYRDASTLLKVYTHAYAASHDVAADVTERLLAGPEKSSGKQMASK